MEPHADFAVAVSQKVEVETSVDPGDGLAAITGRVIAIGWWVDQSAEGEPGHEPSGTLYLVADQNRPRPYWIKQADLTAVRLLE